MYVCIINIQVPHEAKNQRALAKRTRCYYSNGNWYYVLRI